MTPPLLTVSELKRHYRVGDSLVRALDGVSMTVAHGEFLSLVGASGSGKSTLLNLIGGLDTPTSGAIAGPAGELTRMSSKQLSAYRARDVGIVFQSFNLLAHRTALDNVELALYFTRDGTRDRRKKATEVLERLGLRDRLQHRPDDLSGGEQQRVALARALVKDPTLLLADEPTGNLDRENAQAIIQVLADWNRNGGTIILVTHNLELAHHYSHRVLKLDYGQIVAAQAGGKAGGN